MTRERNGRQVSSTSSRSRVKSAGESNRRTPPAKEKRKREGVGALVVIGAMVLCMTMVIFAIWSTGMAAEPDTALAGDNRAGSQTLNRGALQTAGGTAAVQAGADFQQLSDPLLVLVNYEVPLPEGWQVTPNFIGEETVDIRIYNDLNGMFLAAENDGITLWVASGYRSVEDQERILSREIQLHMANDGMSEEEAREYSLRTINPPGYSEHHTGLVVDLNNVDDAFEETEAYKWLKEHAAEYGFVQRYRTDKVEYTGIDNESWHYRYVGKEHAQEMERLDMCLEEYVQYLKDQGVQ